MPSSDTITTWNTFTAKTLIKSADVNNNFDVFRGHLLPVDASAAAAADNAYDLGSSTYRWRNIHAVGGSGNVPSWQAYTISSASFSTATTSADIELYSSPAKGMIQGIVFCNGSNWTATGMTNITVSLGIAGELERYAAATSINTSTVNEPFSIMEMTDFTATTSIRVSVVGTGANLDQLTASTMEIHVLRGALA